MTNKLIFQAVSLLTLMLILAGLSVPLASAAGPDDWTLVRNLSNTPGRSMYHCAGPESG